MFHLEHRDHILARRPHLVSPNRLQVKIQNKVLLLTPPPSYLFEVMSYQSTGHTRKTQTDWSSLELFKVLSELEPSGIRPLSCGTCSRLCSTGQTTSRRPEISLLDKAYTDVELDWNGLV